MKEFEQLNIFDMTLPKFRIDKPIRLIELFAGIGSQAMALRDLGAKFEHHRVVEFDKYAIASYNAIHGTNFPAMDITKISGLDLDITETDKYCYIMTYSFPCQDLSMAGKQKGMAKGSGTRSGLLWEVERILNEVENLPQVLLMENVPQIHNQANMPDFQKWIEFLKSKGYSNQYKDLNAKNFGIPQNRNRCFMVSILGNYSFDFMEPFVLEKNVNDFLLNDVKENYYIYTERISKVLIGLKYNNKLPKQSAILTPKRTEYGKKIRKAYESGMIKEKRGNMVELQPRADGISNTLTTVEKDNLLLEIKSEVRIRNLTPVEKWRLMGFSDFDFEKAKSVNCDSQLYKQAGRSIVKDVLMGIFKQLIA